MDLYLVELVMPLLSGGGSWTRKGQITCAAYQMTQGWFQSCGRKAIGVASVDWQVEHLGDPRERSRAVQGA